VGTATSCTAGSEPLVRVWKAHREGPRLIISVYVRIGAHNVGTTAKPTGRDKHLGNSIVRGTSCSLSARGVASRKCTQAASEIGCGKSKLKARNMSSLVCGDMITMPCTSRVCDLVS
jgi:hypothetical protein